MAQYEGNMYPEFPSPCTDANLKPTVSPRSPEGHCQVPGQRTDLSWTCYSEFCKAGLGVPCPFAAATELVSGYDQDTGWPKHVFSAGFIGF